MADDYTTTALVKRALGIDASDTSEDATIAAKISTSSRQIDRHCGYPARKFWLDATATARVVNPHGRVVCTDDGERLLVDDIGSASGFVVEVGRSGSWTDITSSVELEPLEALSRDPAEPVTSLLYEDGHFSAYRRVRVTAKWGWPAVPDVVGEAALIQTTRLYRRKDSPEGVLGSAEWGGVVRLARLDPDVAALLSALALPGFA